MNGGKVLKEQKSIAKISINRIIEFLVVGVVYILVKQFLFK